MTFGASMARELVILHTLVAIVLVGAVSHHAIVALRFLRGEYRVRLARIYAATTAVTYLATLALGALAYPTFRVDVRAGYLDAHAPWASWLFERKEDLATLGVPAVIGVWLLARALEPRQDRLLLPGYVALVLLTTGIVWFDLTAGLLITMVKGVG